MNLYLFVFYEGVQMKYLLLVSCFFIVSCASTESEEVLVSIENDPRIGEKVQQACFINSIQFVLETVCIG